jgi:hypothetical protein
MPKQCNGEGIARVLDGPEVVTGMETLGDVPVEQCREGGVQEVSKVEGVVLEDHEIGGEEGILQLRMEHVACIDAAEREEAPLELWEKEGREVDGGRGEAAGDGCGVELAIEYATVEAGIVGRAKEVVEATACEHEREEGARRRGWRLVVEREDDVVLHCVLKERELGKHDKKKETRKGERRRGSEDIKDRGNMEGMSFISTKRRLEREVGDATPTSRSV